MRKWRQFFAPSFQHMKNVSVRFDPTSSDSTGSKEFLFQAVNRKLARSNPKCVVSHEFVFDRSPPVIELTYRNDEKFKMLCANKTVDEIMFDMCTYTAMLENATGMGEEEELEEEDDDDGGSSATAGAAAGGAAGAAKK